MFRNQVAITGSQQGVVTPREESLCPVSTYTYLNSSDLLKELFISNQFN